MESVELRILIKSIGGEQVVDTTNNLGRQFNLLGITAGVAAASITAASAAVYKFVASEAQAAKSTVDLASKLELSVGVTERYQFMAQRTGSSIESLQGAVKIFAQSLSDSSGKGKEAYETLRLLGIATTDATGKQREIGSIFQDTLRRLSFIGDESKRVTLAMRLLGEGGASGVRNLLKEFDSASAAATRFGLGIDENATKRLAETDRKIQDLTASIGQLRKALADRFNPVVIPVVEKLIRLTNGEAGPLDLIREGFVDTNINLGKSIGLLTGTIDPDIRALLDSRAPGNPDSAKKLLDPVIPPSLKKKPGSSDVGTLRLYDLFAAAATANGNRRRNPPTLYTLAERFRLEMFGGNIPGVDMVRDIPLTMGGTSSAIAGLGDSLGLLGGVLTNSSEEFSKRLSIERSTLQTRERLIELLAGPGGEVEAARLIRDLRLESARDEIEASEANLNYQLRIAEIAKRGRDEWRNTIGQVFDASVAGGGGFSSLFRSFGLGTARTLAQNAGDMFYRPGSLTLPGQVGSDGKLNLMGKLLAGTPFAIDPSKLAMDANTRATVDNTAALIAAAGGNPAAVLGGAGVSGGILSTIGTLTGGGGRNPFILTAAKGLGGSGSQGTPYFNELGEIEGYLPSKASGLAKSVGYAGALAGGAFGVMSGIQQGGFRGAVTASGSAAGAASALLALSGATGPAAPILAGAALALGVVGSLFPDPKKVRDAAINREIDSRRFSDFSGTSYSTDTFGRGFDYSFRGDMRPIVVNINAMDKNSVIDHRDDIAEAVRVAMSETHPVVKEMQSALLPGA